MRIRQHTTSLAARMLQWSRLDVIRTEERVSKLVINADLGRHRIDRNIYGHFSEHLGRCIYEGYWVGQDSPIPNTRGIRNDVVQALRKLKPPILRWPGGCFADEYHWMDGVGPRESRPRMVNTHWGGVTENNHFGTHEFLDLCEMIGADPYICGNVGSGEVREMQQWVEYITFPGVSSMADLRRRNGREEPWRLPYFGVGNENWGCGGSMRPEYYADLYRRYNTYVRDLGGYHIHRVACGPNRDDYRWTEVLMREAGSFMDGLALHYYCGTGKRSRSATRFHEDDWFFLLKNALVMDEMITRHSAIMDRYDPAKRVSLAVDEWGTWHDVEPGTNPGFLYQQNTLRDALAASITLDVFNSHCERVRMGCIAQTVNVLQAMVLTDGARMLVTPTYHVFEMYQVHQDATMLPVHVECAEYEMDGDSIPRLSASASRDASGATHVSITNLHHDLASEVDIGIRGASVGTVSGRVLTADVINAHNTFDEPEKVKPTEFADFRIADGKVTVRLPARSVTVLRMEEQRG